MMRSSNQWSACWRLPRGRILRRVAAGERLLRVARGRLWITRDGSLARPAEDCVLAGGQQMVLARGDAVVIEAFEDSELEFLEPAR